MGDKVELTLEQKLALRRTALIDEDRFFQIKSGSATLTMDLMWVFSKLKQKIQLLNRTDQEKVIKAYKAYQLKVEEYKREYQEHLKDSVPDISFKLMEENESRILEMFGRYYTAEEILKVVKLEWGLSNIDLLDLQTFERLHQDTIQQLRLEFKNNVDGMRLVQKRSRIEELTELYTERKDIYLKTRSRSDEEALLKMLKMIQSEAEGTQITLNGKLDLKIEHSMAKDIHSELLKGLNLNQIIITRVAGSLGINPLYLLTKLSNSYYAKISGFGRGISDPRTEEIEYPTNIVYDWEQIRTNHQKMVEEEDRQKSFEDVPYEEVPQIISIREQLLAKIREQQRK